MSQCESVLLPMCATGRHWPPLPLAFPSQQALFEAIARASVFSYQKYPEIAYDILCLIAVIAVIADVFFFAALLMGKTGPPVTISD